MHIWIWQNMTEHGGYTKLVKFEDICNTTSHIARPILGL